jgi:hypothetical protein
LSDLPVIGVDPGPLARLEAVKADETAPNVIFQRLCDGETLKEIARSWELPKGRFAEWFTVKHADLYDAALKVRADELAHETLEIADEQAEVVKKDGGTYDPDVARDKLRVETRLKLAAQWDRSRYGSKDNGPAGGGVTVIVNRSIGSDPVPVTVDGNTLTVDA